MTTYATIRQDLYNQDLLIPAVNAETGEQKYLDPVMWTIASSNDETYTLNRPFPYEGERWQFASIDLDFCEVN